MCGIAGIMTVSGAAPDGAALDRLARLVGHRGPDGGGRHVSGGVGLVHARLAIIDLETGDQPLFAPARDGHPDAAAADRVALIANAEIYNHVELRLDMGRVAFTTKSDCEPPLHLYLRHGLGFARHLRGMYAIAIHDPVENLLVLVRDPFGIKPLYYAETPETFVFASEPQALLGAGMVAPGVRAEARDELLQLQFTTGDETIFPGIRRLLPGETIAVRHGRVTDRLRLSALPAGGPRPIGRGVALERLDEALEDSVGIHQRSDVPYGMFLSGGIDSSALLAMMERLNADPVLAFTAGFDVADAADERAQARAAAETTGARHVEIAFGEDDFWASLPAVATAMDDPAADYAVLPTFKLAARARDEGIKVVLTGEGGDELFGGYGRYRRARRPRILGGRPMRHRGAFDGLGVLRADPVGWRDAIRFAEEDANRGGRTRLQVLQAADCADWLPNDLLAKLDRCLMAHGVEGRVPYLDVKLAEFAFRLPDALKIRRGRGKWLLRRWLQTGLPVARPFAAKQGFTVPVADWIGARGRELGPLVAADEAIAEICRPGTVEELFRAAGPGRGRRAGHAAWTLLFYALWHRRHVRGQAARGGVFDVLGEAA